MKKYQVEILDKNGDDIWKAAYYCNPDFREVIKLIKLHTGFDVYTVDEDKEAEEYICYDCETSGGYHIVNFIKMNDDLVLEAEHIPVYSNDTSYCCLSDADPGL